MNRKKSAWKQFRLTLVFASTVFLILLATMLLTFCGVILLEHTDAIQGSSFRRVPLFSFCVASVLVGTVLSFGFGKRPLRPIHELMDAADKIADGDYSVRLALRGPEDIRVLGEKFNHMAAELGSVEMLRTDFVNNFSHEFKTPIVSIGGFAKMLRRTDLTEAEREEYLDIIISESNRLTELASSILNLSKIEGQTILTDKKRFNLSEQIRLVIAQLDSKWSKKHICFSFDCGEYEIVGNEGLLRQVWINLLDNAVKFSPEGGTIKARITERVSGFEINVTDSGEGMSAEIASHIFDRFYQGNTSHAHQGNGIGLTITKRVVELHGGTIRVDSAPGKGTTMEVFLPRTC